ncbi:hypothetical protein KAB08_03045 [Acinetobacter baumannii]|nr:hypothetical protein [Acinetobacter baumannii]AOX98018.1 hypothetical protein KAB08_03045 [Acinetobacter baumannii]
MNTDVVELKTINEVGLPLDPETFSRVILDFLGRKENLSYNISQFNHILNSKISYQKILFLNIFQLTLDIQMVLSRNKWQ